MLLFFLNKLLLSTPISQSTSIKYLFYKLCYFCYIPKFRFHNSQLAHHSVVLEMYIFFSKYSENKSHPTQPSVNVHYITFSKSNVALLQKVA